MNASLIDAVPCLTNEMSIKDAADTIVYIKQCKSICEIMLDTYCTVQCFIIHIGMYGANSNRLGGSSLWGPGT